MPLIRNYKIDEIVENVYSIMCDQDQGIYEDDKIYIDFSENSLEIWVTMPDDYQYIVLKAQFIFPEESDETIIICTVFRPGKWIKYLENLGLKLDEDFSPIDDESVF